MKSDEGMGLDAHAEELSVFAGACEIGHDESLCAALVALDEAHARRCDIDIESFFVWILQICAIGSEKLATREAEATSPGDLKRGQAVDVWLLRHMLNVVAPSNKRRIERATVVCEVEILDRCFLLEVIVRCDILFAFFVGEARAHFKAYASVGDELKCAKLTFAFTFRRDDAPNALELVVEKCLALLQVHRRAVLLALRHIGTEHALQHLTFIVEGEILFISLIEFNARLADFPVYKIHSYARMIIAENLLKKKHARHGVELRLYDVECVEGYLLGIRARIYASD
jgi:hypothetical protein